MEGVGCPLRLRLRETPDNGFRAEGERRTGYQAAYNTGKDRAALAAQEGSHG